jgi:hypothetical protein
MIFNLREYKNKSFLFTFLCNFVGKNCVMKENGGVLCQTFDLLFSNTSVNDSRKINLGA